MRSGVVCTHLQGSFHLQEPLSLSFSSWGPAPISGAGPLLPRDRLLPDSRGVTIYSHPGDPSPSSPVPASVLGLESAVPALNPELLFPHLHSHMRLRSVSSESAVGSPCLHTSPSAPLPGPQPGGKERREGRSEAHLQRWEA